MNVTDSTKTRFETMNCIGRGRESTEPKEISILTYLIHGYRFHQRSIHSANFLVFSFDGVISECIQLHGKVTEP